MREPIVNTFARLTHWNQFSYRGVLVQRSGSGYKIGSVWCANKDEVDAAINERIEKLSRSLLKIKPNVSKEKVSPEAHSAKS